MSLCKIRKRVSIKVFTFAATRDYNAFERLHGCMVLHMNGQSIKITSGVESDMFQLCLFFLVLKDVAFPPDNI